MENSSSLAPQQFPFGSVIVSENSLKQMIVVLQGSAGVYKNYKMTNEVFVKSVGQGSFACEQSLFLNKEHDEALVALTDVLALSVTRNNIKEFFTKYPDAAFSIVEQIYKRLAETAAALDKYERQQPKEGAGQGGAGFKKSTLFPEGHTDKYTLPLTHNQTDIICLNKTACPLCGRKFETHYILSSKLRRIGNDADMRVRYKDVEPLYYNIITCPNCLYSAETTNFSEAPKRQSDAVNAKIGPYRLDTVIQTGNDRDTHTVFIGYYLALLCAPIVAESHELTTAGLWLKISRLYEDCKDSKMHLYAIKQALASYNYVYSNLRISDNQTQQVRCLLGELYFKLGDYDAARQFLFMIKSDKDAPASLKRQAENRLESIREIKKTESET
ncbi:MAG: DUF2225 domain-containing protein [Oscillospiraceae bacterium]|jgi:uncharacterized protein (DUF2225 family)|nr:DUF2225 domain-containing protein [Oscillospiraceae bacterium]